MESAEPLYQRGLSIWEQTFGPLHPSVANGLINLITLYTQQGRFAEAEPLYQRALDVWEQSQGFEHSLVTYGETVELVCLNLTLPVDVIYEETSIPISEQLDTLEEEDREC